MQRKALMKEKTLSKNKKKHPLHTSILAFISKLVLGIEKLTGYMSPSSAG